MKRGAPLDPHPRPTWGRNRSIAAILLVLGAGLVLRTQSLSLAPFQIDEGFASLLATQVANLRAFPTMGIRTSYGFHNPPLFVYLLAPFFLLTSDPRFAMFGIAMCGTGGAALLARTCSRLAGWRAGVIAAVLMSFCPNAIMHSRRLWGHDLVLFFAALALWATVKAIQHRQERLARRAARGGRAREARGFARDPSLIPGWQENPGVWMAVALCACGAAQCLHLSGSLTWVIPLGAMAAFRFTRSGKALLVGGAFLFAMYLPWLADGGLGEIAAIRDVLLGHAASGHNPPAVDPVLAWLFLPGDSVSQDVLGGLYDELYLDVPGRVATPAMLAIGGALTLLALSFFTRRLLAWSRERWHSRWAAVLLAAALLPCAAFSLLRVEAVPPYMLPALVPLLAGAALALDRLASRGAAWSSAVWALLLAFAASGFIYSRTVMLLVGGAGDSGSRLPATVLAFQEEAVLGILRLTGDEPYSLMQDGRTPEAGIDAALFYVNFWLTGNPSAPTDRSSRNIFVLHDLRTRLRPEIDAHLAQTNPVGRSGNLLIYWFRGGDAVEWRGLVSRYPSARPPDG